MAQEVVITESSRPIISAPRSGVLVMLATLVAIGCLASFTIVRLFPPAPVAADAPPTEFSSGRAMKLVRAISVRPHPIGTSANHEVRDRLIGELTALGFTPEMQRATGMNLRWGGVIPAGMVENILIRLKGTQSGKAVLLMAHYDTVTSAPGAADDGAGVAAVLETLRALRAGAPLKNDVIALLTDGEEVGLLGSEAFMREHPWAKDVGLVLNFEARGNGGPSIMFETSERNGWLISQFAQASPRPVANSLSYELYRLLPFDTDLRPLKEAGLAGLNFAFINGPNHQHNQTDAPEFIDVRSVQHHGAQALALTRQFGGADLRGAQQQGKAVYFDLFSVFLARYPEAWVLPCAALVMLLGIGVVALGLKREHLKTSRVTVGAIVFLLVVTLPAAAATLLWWALRTLYPDYRMFIQEHTYNSGFYMMSFLALALAVDAALYVLFRRRARVADLMADALLCWSALLVLTSLYLPGGSYLFTCPPLFVAVGLGYLFATTTPGPEHLKERHSVLLLVCAVPGAILLAPLTYLMYVSLGMALLAPTVALAALLSEALALYDAWHAGRELRLEPTRPFQEYIGWLQRQDSRAAERFWRGALEGFTTPTPLRVEGFGTTAASNGGAQYGRHELKLTAALQQFARTHKLTLNTVVQGAWAMLLSRYSGEEDVLFGATVAGRPPELEGVNRMVGLFINTLPVRARVRRDADPVEWLRAHQARLSEMRQYEYSSLLQVKGWSEVPAALPLFETLLVFENYPVGEALKGRAGSVEVRDLHMLEQTNYPLTAAVVPGAELSLLAGYDQRRFDHATVDRIMGHWRSLLEGIAAGPPRRLGDLHLSADAGRRATLREWDAPPLRSPSAGACIISLKRRRRGRPKRRRSSSSRRRSTTKR